MFLLKNPFRGTTKFSGPDGPFPSTDEQGPAKLLERCPAHKPTPLVEVSAHAQQLGISALHMKDERQRMGLGSFKALGAAYVIAHAAASENDADPQSALRGQTFVTASAGNHGLSVAAGAKLFGAQAVIYLSNTVPASFASRLEEKGARVVIEGDDYQASMDGALKAAADNGWNLLSDTSWDEYVDSPTRLMEGYVQLSDETKDQIDQPPTHIFLQAGVGGLATAIAAHSRKSWGDAPTIIVVEPDRAPALFESIKAGKITNTPGEVSNMGRLDCKEPSLVAINGLARDADWFVLVSDAEAQRAVDTATKHDFESSPSGIAGLAGLTKLLAEPQVGIDANSRVLLIVSEEPA